MVSTGALVKRQTVVTCVYGRGGPRAPARPLRACLSCRIPFRGTDEGVLTTTYVPRLPA